MFSFCNAVVYNKDKDSVKTVRQRKGVGPLAKKVTIQVYGAEQVCASCVGAPSSKDTFEWLGAALSRKYPGQPFDMRYIDIFSPGDDPDEKAFAQKVLDEDLFYPVVVIEGEVAAEGNPTLKKIYAKMEQYGYTPSNAQSLFRTV